MVQKPAVRELLIEGQLYTIKHWEKLIQERDNFSEKEKQQLQALYRHYRYFYENHNTTENFKQLRRTLNVAEKIGVKLERQTD